jgi:hypothetical protein
MTTRRSEQAVKTKLTHRKVQTHNCTYGMHSLFAFFLDFSSFRNFLLSQLAEPLCHVFDSLFPLLPILCYQRNCLRVSFLLNLLVSLVRQFSFSIRSPNYPFSVQASHADFTIQPLVLACSLVTKFLKNCFRSVSLFVVISKELSMAGIRKQNAWMNKRINKKKHASYRAYRPKAHSGRFSY